MIPIEYRDFYDVPRLFVAFDKRGTYLFSSPFLDDEDEYAGYFDVFRLEPFGPGDLPSWVWEEPASSGTPVGRVPVAEVRFGPTRRDGIDRAVLDAF